MGLRKYFLSIWRELYLFGRKPDEDFRWGEVESDWKDDDSLLEVEELLVTLIFTLLLFNCIFFQSEMYPS